MSDCTQRAYVVQEQGFCIYAFQHDDNEAAQPGSNVDKLVTSAFYMTAAVVLGCMFAYLVTAACDRRVGAAVRSRNVGRLQRYVIGATILLLSRVVADAVPCGPARPGPLYWTYWLYFPLFLIGLLNAAVLGRNVLGPLLQGTVLLPASRALLRVRALMQVPRAPARLYV